MHELISYHIPDAVRVQVIKLESHSGYAEDDSSIDVRRFSVDPLVTNFSGFQAAIVNAFNLKSDFILSYYRTDLNRFVPLQSEWDLDAAYITSSQPFLQVKMVVERVHTGYTDWDIITIADISRLANKSSYGQSKIASNLFSQVEKLANKMSRAFPVATSTNAIVTGGSVASGSMGKSSLTSSPGGVSGGGGTSSADSSYNSSFNSPLNEKQYLSFLDSEGRVRSFRELRITVYRRGLEPGLRKTVWKQLLNVFPPGLTGQQRLDYMKAKCDLYADLKNTWQSHMSDSRVESVHSMVKKDVLRTDRKQSFYSGDENNKNVKALLNILTTYSLNHEISYCQGMSDLASPILFVMKDEAQAYLCFCALMKRAGKNFSTDGTSMSLKFQNLIQLVMYYDPEFYWFLKQKNAQELLFCYRWLLLDLKREFPFEESLRVLEVLWASIPPNFKLDLPLFDPESRYCPESAQSTPTASTFFPQSLTGSSKVGTIRPGASNSIAIGKFDPEIMSVGRANHQIMSNSVEVSNEKRSRFEDEMNISSGRGSMSASVSSTPGTLVSNSAPVSRPFGLRRIRFLPQMLSTDSRDMDSPEDEEAKTMYPLPPRFIERQISIDYEEKRRMREAKFGGSFEREELRRVRSFEVDADGNRSRKSSLGSLSPKRRAQLARFNSSGKARLLLRQKAAEQKFDDRRQKSIEPENPHERFFHCNGFDSFDDHDNYNSWAPPIGLIRSSSYDSLHGSQYFTPTGSFHENSFYESADHEGVNSVKRERVNEVGSPSFEESRSQSSSCSSLVILSSTGLVLDYSQNFRVSLPSPEELGSDDAFMLFLCLTLLLQQRDMIMNQDLDANEIAMYFDSLLRKHKVNPVLETSRQLFHSYLSQWHRTSMESDAAADELMQKTLLKFPSATPNRSQQQPFRHQLNHHSQPNSRNQVYQPTFKHHQTVNKNVVGRGQQQRQGPIDLLL